MMLKQKVLVIQTYAGDHIDSDFYILMQSGYDIQARYELYQKHGGYHGHGKKSIDEILKSAGIIRNIIESDPIIFLEED